MITETYMDTVSLFSYSQVMASQVTVRVCLHPCAFLDTCYISPLLVFSSSS